jgi:hypothetical protein
MAFGLIMAFGLNMAFDLIMALSLTMAFGLNKLIKLINGLVDRIKLFKLSELIVKYPIGLIVRINGLNEHTNPNGLIGLVGGCIIGLINLLALLNHWLNGPC